MPRVTVIIPTYNWSTVLPYSIGSVLRQTYDDWELLVMGDGCTDDSEAVVERVKREHPHPERAARVRWINLPENTGSQSGPNNEGLRQARGEYVAYLGHDDLWLPHHLSCLVASLDAGADAAHSIARFIYTDINGKAVQSQAWSPVERQLAASTLIHRKDVVISLGGWRPYEQLQTWTDLDLWRRLIASNFRTDFVPRLSVIKPPATLRRNVYKIRPSHEQAAWFERIGLEPDLEATELVKLLQETQHTLMERKGSLAAQYRTLLLSETPKSVREKFRLWFPRREANGAFVERSRQFRGLDKRESAQSGE